MDKNVEIIKKWLKKNGSEELLDGIVSRMKRDEDGDWTEQLMKWIADGKNVIETFAFLSWYEGIR